MDRLIYKGKYFKNKIIDTTGELFPEYVTPAINENEIIQKSCDILSELGVGTSIVYNFLSNNNDMEKFRYMDTLHDVPHTENFVQYSIFKERFDFYNLKLHPEKFLEYEGEPYRMWVSKYIKVKEKNLKNNTYKLDDIGISQDDIIEDIKKTFKEHMKTRASLGKMRDVKYSKGDDGVQIAEIFDRDEVTIEFEFLKYSLCNKIQSAIETLAHLISYDVLCRGDFISYYDYDIARIKYYKNLKDRVISIIKRKGLNLKTIDKLYKKIEKLYVTELKTINEIEDILNNTCEETEKKFISYALDNYKNDNGIIVTNETLNIVEPVFIQRRVTEKINSINVKQIKETSSETMLSNDELIIYNKLCEIYGKDNILKEYKSEKYPFHCDFYIKSKDMFIEYQGFWAHGGEKYIGTKQQQQKLKSIVDKIQEKRIYRILIDTWTVKDVVKRQWAKSHNLNWIEFFNLNEFNKWIENSS